jgi:hypothetical protein
MGRPSVLEFSPRDFSRYAPQLFSSDLRERCHLDRAFEAHFTEVL